MKTKFWVALAVGLLALGSVPVAAESLLEIRGGVGINGSDPDDFNDQLNNQAADLDFGSFSNYNLDLFFNIPAFPIGIGLRHEWLNEDKSSGADSAEVDVNHLCVLVDLRLLDNDLFYVGPIAGIGYPWGDLKIAGGQDSDLDKTNLTYTLGGEAGLKLGRFILAAEAGYTSLRLETEDDSTKVDLSGFYGKAMVGIGVF